MRCSNNECSTSTGVHGGLTFGSGRLTDNGYFEFPCGLCARAWETEHAIDKHHEDDIECWPFPGQNIEELTADIQKELKEAEEAYPWACCN